MINWGLYKLDTELNLDTPASTATLTDINKNTLLIVVILQDNENNLNLNAEYVDWLNYPVGTYKMQDSIVNVEKKLTSETTTTYEVTITINKNSTFNKIVRIYSLVGGGGL